SSRRRHTRFSRDWSSDVCSSDLVQVRPSAPADLLEGLLTGDFFVSSFRMQSAWKENGWALDGCAGMACLSLGNDRAAKFAARFSMARIFPICRHPDGVCDKRHPG